MGDCADRLFIDAEPVGLATFGTRQTALILAVRRETSDIYSLLETTIAL